MRIVGGQYGGRRLHAPKNYDIRPTGDKVRGAIFNALQARNLIEGAVVLDCFCGTGALGLEALSRGAAHCCFVDHNKLSLDLARTNATSLDAENHCEFILQNSLKLDAPVTGYLFDLIFLDPPYRKNILDVVLKQLIEKSVLKKDTICIAEAEKEYDFKMTHAFSVQSEKVYGESKVLFLEYTP